MRYLLFIFLLSFSTISWNQKNRIAVCNCIENIKLPSIIENSSNHFTQTETAFIDSINKIISSGFEFYLAKKYKYEFFDVCINKDLEIQYDYIVRITKVEFDKRLLKKESNYHATIDYTVDHPETEAGYEASYRSPITLTKTIYVSALRVQLTKQIEEMSPTIITAISQVEDLKNLVFMMDNFEDSKEDTVSYISLQEFQPGKLASLTDTVQSTFRWDNENRIIQQIPSEATIYHFAKEHKLLITKSQAVVPLKKGRSWTFGTSVNYNERIAIVSNNKGKEYLYFSKLKKSKRLKKSYGKNRIAKLNSLMHQAGVWFRVKHDKIKGDQLRYELTEHCKDWSENLIPSLE